MTTTASPGFQAMPQGGLRPLMNQTQWYYEFEDDAPGLETSGDDRDYFRLATNSVLLNGFAVLGDFDSNGTPLITHDIIANLAVNGAAAADHKLVGAVIVGRVGGRIDFGDGTTPVHTPPLGMRVEADDGIVSLKCTASAATAQTDNRHVLFAILVGNSPS